MNWQRWKPSGNGLAELLLSRRWGLVILVVLLTAGMGLFVPDIRVDRSLKDFYVSLSHDNVLAERLHSVFGTKEYILVAIENDRPATDPAVLEALAAVTDRLSQLEAIEEVRTLSNLRTFQKKQVYRMAPVLREDDTGRPTLPEKGQLERLRKAIPAMALLLSEDQKTVGILILVKPELRFDQRMRKLLSSIESIVRNGFGSDSKIRLVGLPVIREGVVRYTFHTAVTFGLVALLVSSSAALYIFKGLRVAIIYWVSVCFSLLWMAGLMSAIGMKLNMATSISFGIILVVSIATIIHIVTHYDQMYQNVNEPQGAAVAALNIVGRPCLMCTLTSAGGFASILVSSIPMIRQAGLIMATGVVVSFVIVMVFTPTFLTIMKPVNPATYSRMTRDAVSWTLERTWRLVIVHHKACVAVFILVFIASVVSSARIQIGTDPLRMFSSHTPEYQDLQFVQDNLAPMHSVELLVEGKDKAFRKAETWKRVSRFEERLGKMPNVAGTDSLLSFLKYLHELIVGPDGQAHSLYSNPGVLSELLTLMSSSTDGRDLLRKYLDDKFVLMRMSVRLKHFTGVPIADMIREIREVALSELGSLGNVELTGVLAIYSGHISELVRSQILSLLLATSVITLLMIIQFRSITLGILSLIPNALPLVVIFGIMGWTGIRLDSMTVLAAAVMIGLSVDDTIHYLTQFKREMIRGRHSLQGIDASLLAAFRTTGRALTSTSAVLFFGILALAWSSFQPIAHISILLSCGVLAALAGDLVFMPAIILSIPRLKDAISRSVAGQE